MLYLPLAAVAQLAAPATAGPAELSSRYTELGSCAAFAQGDVDQGQDWVFHKCQGYDGIPIWLAFMDSARSQLGFGSRPNASGVFGLDRDDSWLVEWRGVNRDGRFEPYAVIVRMTRPAAGVPGDQTGSLFVYRLRSDGLSCMVASDLSSNDEARETADGSRQKYKCLSEPSELDLS
jgi:hypothetical protein